MLWPSQQFRHILAFGETPMNFYRRRHHRHGQCGSKHSSRIVSPGLGRIMQLPWICGSTRIQSIKWRRGCSMLFFLLRLPPTHPATAYRNAFR